MSEMKDEREDNQTAQILDEAAGEVNQQQHPHESLQIHTEIVAQVLDADTVPAEEDVDDDEVVDESSIDEVVLILDTHMHDDDCCVDEKDEQMVANDKNDNDEQKSYLDEEGEDDNDDEHEHVLVGIVPTVVSIPVGITIAYKRKGRSIPADIVYRATGATSANLVRSGSTMTDNAIARVDHDDDLFPNAHANAIASEGGDHFKIPIVTSKAALAKKKRRTMKKSKHSRKYSSSSGISTTSTVISRGYKKPIASLTVFLEGTTLYLLCLAVPTLFGFMINLFYSYYDDVNVDNSNAFATNDQLTQEAVWSPSFAWYDLHGMIQHRVMSVRLNFYRQVDDVCSTHQNLLLDGFFFSSDHRGFVSMLLQCLLQVLLKFISFVLQRSGYCNTVALILLQEEQQRQQRNQSIVSKDTENWVQDVSIIVVCSMVLATLRIWIVQTTVPLEDSTNVAALVRCKSIHLLSSDYAKTMTPVGTPRLVLRARSRQRTDNGSKQESDDEEDANSVDMRSILLSLSQCKVPDLSAKEAPSRDSVYPIHQQPMHDNSFGHDIGMRYDDETDRDGDDNENRNNMGQSSTMMFMPMQMMNSKPKKPVTTSITPVDPGHGDSEMIGTSVKTTGFVETSEEATTLKPTTLLHSTPVLEETAAAATTTPAVELSLSKTSCQESDYKILDSDDYTEPISFIKERLDGEDLCDHDVKELRQFLQDKVATAFTTSTVATEQENEQNKFRVTPIKIRQQSQEFGTEKFSSQTPIPPRTRVNAAPRYATALFRLLWSTFSSISALYLFRKSSFWPWYLGGTGSTASCWDLSGGLSVGGMDSDFDHSNNVLKRYFLGQAGYHWHSGAFHILSMIILLLHPSTKKGILQSSLEQDEFAPDDNRENYWTDGSPERTISTNRTLPKSQPKKHVRALRLLVGSSSTAYVRSLAQHTLALALIASAYIFSSLRRLGVIGMFAFDVSNWFLHLLQICMNAPVDSKLKQSNVVFWIYWVGVIPSFVLTRFVIWPMLWYSAIFESRRWLIQLERTLWIGSASVLRGIFHVWMLLIQILNMVYFYRLLYHPHLQTILKQQHVATNRISSKRQTKKLFQSNSAIKKKP